jgi:hypothetical protein
MQLTRNVTTRETKAVAHRTISAYLEGAGFRPVVGETFLTYERGSVRGSMFSFSPKKWHTRATVQFTPSSAGPEGTDVFIALDVNTTGQIVLKRERAVLEKELDGLVAAVSGTPAEASIESQPPALQQVSADQERYRLESQHKSGANWFYWIAGLSLINTLMNLFGGRFSFLVGLGITQLVDGIVLGVSGQVAQDMALVVKIVGFAVNLTVAVVFIVFGILARQKRKWPFIVGMALYALDALLFIWVGDWWSFGFHLLALWGLSTGMKARNRLAEMAA